VANGVVAYLPSPSTNVVHLGPLTVRMYGLMLLLGIGACTWLTVRRWVRWGGQPELVFRVALWGVLGGIVGARLYHVVTSWSLVPEPKWQGVFEVWNGGLGIWGGVLFGCAAGALVVRRAGVSVRWMLDAVAPGLLLGQGIGRWGNWWNQELFGKPTTLPWALKISPANRPPGYLQDATFHPTFLYESLWDLVFVAVLLRIDRGFRLRRPALFALYVSFYTAFRTYEETLRIDLGSHYYAGLRLNFFVSLALFVASTAFFVWWQFLRTDGSAPVVELPERP